MKSTRKEFLHNCCLDYGSNKSECRYFLTRVWDKDSKEWKQKVDTIVDAMEALRNFPQFSTGLHHYERRIIVLDIDNENWSIYESAWASKFPPYNYRLENPDTKHAQYGWILKEPLSPQDPLFKQLNKQIRKLVNFLIKKEFSDTSKIVDTGYTYWRCKNPLYDKFTNVVLNLDIFTDIQDLIGAIDIDSVNELTTTMSLVDSSKKIAKENHIKDPLSSRNEYLVENLREAIWKSMRSKGKENVSFEDSLILAKKIAKEAAIATNKLVEESDKEIEVTAKSVFNFCREKFKDKRNSYNALSRRISLLKRKYKTLQRIVKLFKFANENGGHSTPSLYDIQVSSAPSLNDIQMKDCQNEGHSTSSLYDIQVSSATKKFVQRLNKLDKQAFRNDIEEYAERMQLTGNDIAEQVFEDLKIFDEIFKTKQIRQYTTIKLDSPKLRECVTNAELDDIKDCIEEVELDD